MNIVKVYKIRQPLVEFSINFGKVVIEFYIIRRIFIKLDETHRTY
jgi:hypothetical protein